MTERESWPDPSSEAVARVEYDIAVWVPCPPGFPPGWNRQRWAQMYAENFWKRPGLTYTDLEIGLLATRLTEIHQETYGHVPCHQAFIHLPDPRLTPLPVYLATWKSEGEEGEQLRTMTHASDPASIRAPIVDEFRTENLGTGLRVLVHLPVEGAEGEMYGALSYAWRIERYQTDLRIFTVCRDLGRLQGAIGDIDELAQVTTLGPLTRAPNLEGWSTS